MIKAAFFDVDGTLLSHSTGQVPRSARSALHRLRKRGIKCVLATGRHMLELRELPVRDMEFDGYITLNGQLCLDSRQKVLYGNPLTGPEKDGLLELFARRRLPILLVEKDAMYLNFANAQVEAAQKAISTPLPDLGRYTGNEIYQAVAYVDREKEQTLKRLLPNCKITRWNAYAVDIISSGGRKITGIKRFLEENGIGRQEAMAFGDGENDIEMLRYVQTGVAMGNGEEAVKAQADYVTADVDDDGIEKALAHYGLIPPR